MNCDEMFKIILVDEYDELWWVVYDCTCWRICWFDDVL